MNPLILAVTGASGALYARRLALLLDELDAPIHFIASPAAKQIIAHELGLPEYSLDKFLSRSPRNFIEHEPDDIAAVVASGSYRSHGMVICPCSGRTMAAVAAGLGDNLITRAALAVLKENRRLVLVPREMPLGQIELQNMLKLSQAGAAICPASPGFYMMPKTIDNLVDFVVGRVLDLMNLPHDLNTRWAPPQAPE